MIPKWTGTEDEAGEERTETETAVVNVSFSVE